MPDPTPDDELSGIDVSRMSRDEAIAAIRRVTAAKKAAALAATGGASRDNMLREHRNKIVSDEKRGRYKRDAA